MLSWLARPLSLFVSKPHRCVVYPVYHIFICLPTYFSMLVPNKMQHVLCTGNVGREQYNELRGLAPSVHVVAGDYDDDDLAFPETKVVQIGQFRIGIMHGHQVLPYNSQDAIARMRRKLNVDIFISGHTHKNEVVLQEGFYHINPVRKNPMVGLI